MGQVSESRSQGDNRERGFLPATFSSTFWTLLSHIKKDTELLGNHQTEGSVVFSV